MKLVFATGNEGKMKEIRDILCDTGYEIVSMKQAGVDVEIIEDGATFEENALIKARAVAKVIEEDALVMADDSGLEVDYLGGEPGIYSARYLGEDTPYTIKNHEIIHRLDGVPDEKRTARFVCAIACVFPDGSEKVVRGVVEGIIGYDEKGEHGFGYDPIFYLPEFGCTSAELLPDRKNEISHRGRALRQMEELLGE